MTTQTLDIKVATTVQNMIDMLTIMVDEPETTYIYVDGLDSVNIKLEETTLTDGSTVQDVILS